MNEWILPDKRETYELEVVSFITNKPPASEKQILWELGFTGDDGSAVVMALKDKGKKVQFTVNDFELLGKTVTFYAYIEDQKDQGAKLPMPINYKFKWFSWEKVCSISVKEG